MKKITRDDLQKINARHAVRLVILGKKNRVLYHEARTVTDFLKYNIEKYIPYIKGYILTGTKVILVNYNDDELWTQIYMKGEVDDSKILTVAIYH